MYELLYTSLATYDISAEDLRQLLIQARDKNRRLDITGMLLHHDREFVQLLEGPREHVEDVYASIQRDERNQRVELRYAGPIETRSFSQWAMAFERVKIAQALDPRSDVEPIDEEGLPKALRGDVLNVGKELFLYHRKQLRASATRHQDAVNQAHVEAAFTDSVASPRADRPPR